MIHTPSHTLITDINQTYPLMASLTPSIIRNKMPSETTHSAWRIRRFLHKNYFAYFLNNPIFSLNFNSQTWLSTAEFTQSKDNYTFVKFVLRPSERIFWLDSLNQMAFSANKTFLVSDGLEKLPPHYPTQTPAHPINPCATMSPHAPRPCFAPPWSDGRNYLHSRLRPRHIAATPHSKTCSHWRYCCRDAR